MEHQAYKSINKSVRKKDAMALLLGKGVYTDDVTPDGALIVKILRSPHANAMIASIDTAAAKKVPGVEGVYTWEDVPKKRFAIAGQTYPEPSPYDRLILDRHVRFAGDAVAIVAAESEKAALKAMKLIKVEYDVLKERYTAMTIGQAGSNFVDSVKGAIDDATAEVPTTSAMQQAIAHATKLIKMRPVDCPKCD